MASLLKLTIALLCISVLAVSGQAVKKGERKKRNPQEAFAKMFKAKPGQESSNKTMRLGTTPITAAFNRTSLKLRKENKDDMSAQELGDVKALLGSRCPDRTLVFNLTGMATSEAIRVARRLRPFLPPPENSTSGARPATPPGGINFLSIVCWNDTKEALQQLMLQIPDMDLIQSALHCKLLSRLTRTIAVKMARLMPTSVQEMTCNLLKKADTRCILAMAELFPCDNILTDMAQSDPSVAEAMLKKRRDRGLGRMNSTEWDELLLSMGKALPADILDQAPPEKIKQRFAALWDKTNAPALMEKVNFTTVDENFLRTMGRKVCELPISALEKIPVEKLQAVQSSLSCMKQEKDKAKKRRMVKKMLGTLTVAKCKQVAEDMGVMDERCLKMMDAADIGTLDLASADVEMIPCDTVKEVTSKLQLGNVSTWTRETMQKYGKLLRCPRKMDDDDIVKVAEAIENGNLPEDVQLPRHIRKKIFQKSKERATSGGKTLDAAALTKMKAVVSSMSSKDVDQLLTPSVISSALGSMQKQFKRMGRAARTRIFSKLTANQLQPRLCALDVLGEDIPTQKLDEMTDLVDEIVKDDCKFRCKTEGGQCEVLFSKLNATMDNWDNVPRDVLARFRDSRAICGMSLEVLTSLPPSDQLIDVAGAFFRAFCMDSAKSRQFYDKVSLYRELVLKRNFTSTEMEALGENYFKHMSADEFRAQRLEDQRLIAPLLGTADLDDADSEWFREMAAAAVNAIVGSTGDISSASALSLGRLICGLSADHVSRLTQPALQDAMPVLSQCSDVNTERRSAILRKMTANTPIADMDAADLSQFGSALLSDPDSMGQVSDDAKHDALEDMAQQTTEWRNKLKEKEMRYRDPNPETSRQQEATIKAMRRSLRGMVAARSRVRKAAASGAGQESGSRTKRSTDPPTCDDIRQLGKEASALSEEDIIALSEDDFNDCAAVLGDVTDWSESHKQTLAGKAKEVWGNNTEQWTRSGVAQLAGSILQGLSTADLTSMNLQLEDIEDMAWTPGWKLEQLQAVLSGWLESSGVTSVTADQLESLGHFVCGASSDSISSLIPDETFRATMDSVSDAAKGHCTEEQLKELAAVALRAVGSVTTWSSADTADIGFLMAGLPGTELAKLSSSQMTTMDIDTFTSIPKEQFARLTASQIESLGSNVAMAITADQMSSLTDEQRRAFADLGVTIDRGSNGAATEGPALLMGSLVVMATTTLIMTRG